MHEFIQEFMQHSVEAAQAWHVWNADAFQLCGRRWRSSFSDWLVLECRRAIFYDSLLTEQLDCNGSKEGNFLHCFLYSWLLRWKLQSDLFGWICARCCSNWLQNRRWLRPKQSSFERFFWSRSCNSLRKRSWYLQRNTISNSPMHWGRAWPERPEGFKVLPAQRFGFLRAKKFLDAIHLLRARKHLFERNWKLNRDLSFANPLKNSKKLVPQRLRRPSCWMHHRTWLWERDIK